MYEPLTDSPTYRNATLDTADRVRDLLGRMTLDEKLAQISGTWLPSLVVGDRFDHDHVIATIPHGTGHVTRIGASTGLRPNESAALMNDIQRTMVERTRLGIPVIVHEESVAGFCARDATVFPQAIGLGATWDESLIGEVATVIRAQMIAVGARHTLAPVLDVARDARWGRVEETYGEDPYLIGRLGTAYVRAIQAHDDGGLVNGVMATGKHFLGYGAAESGFNHGPVHLGPRELREVFAEPFSAVIRDAKLASIMNSYSSVDGVACAGSSAILTDLLRGELGFDGVVVADYYAVSLLAIHHKVAGSPADAAILALTAGLDIELPALDCFGEPLKQAVLDGRVDVAFVDRACARVLQGKFELGLFERPYVDASSATEVFDTPRDRALARRAAIQSLVLVRNDGVLPLADAVRSIAVIGPSSDDIRLLQGDYHYPAHVEIAMAQSESTSPGAAFLPEAGAFFGPGLFYTPHVSPLAGISAAAGASGVRVSHAVGCGVRADDSDEASIAAAVMLAASSDVAVLCVGGKSGLTLDATVGEARDASDLRLTGRQEELVRSCAATGTPVVLVVVSGRIHALGDIVDHCAATILAWCPGEEGGNAIADVLFGHAEPGGRLPVSVPVTTGQAPIHHTVRHGGGRALFYGDYADGPSRPLFPFGFGLGYTSFEIGPLEIVSFGTTGESVVLRCSVSNSGQRSGATIVQLYATDEVASVVRLRQMLVGFVRVSLEPAEVRTLTFTVHPSRLAFYDATMRFVCEPGRFRFTVGQSSADTLNRAVVDLAGDVVTYLQRAIVATTCEVDRSAFL